jgi:type VI secretion system protein ImpE
MSAEDHLQQGNLGQALAELQDGVRKNPGDPKRRVFLFQLLCVMGQWERALTQLKVAGDLDPATLPMVQTYREAIGCETLRRDVFAGNRAPLVMGEPQRWIALALEALRASAAGNHRQAAELRDEAFEGAPVVAGKIDGAPFEWIADADMRLGPFLELIVNGKYYWAPFHRFARIALEPPVDLRDLVWAPAQLTMANGGQSVALIPTRYSGTIDQGNDRQKLSRMTEWQEMAEDTFEGLGQRVLATDSGEYSLLEIREILLEPTPADAASGVAPNG